MKWIGGGNLGPHWVGIVALLLGITFLPAAGMAIDYSALLRTDVDWAEAVDVNVHVGQLFMDDSDWAPVENQFRVGADISYTSSNNLAGFVFGAFYSTEEESDGSGSTAFTVDSQFVEFNLGVRKTFYNFSYMRPFVGLGGAVHIVEVERSGATVDDSDDDVGFGGYAEAGVLFDIYGPFHVGTSIRYGMGRVEIYDAKKDPGGLMISAMIGTHWTND